ncbi:MAG: multicopper oxidase domain-containing protein [Candidatus Thiodiazotropha taylori]
MRFDYPATDDYPYMYHCHILEHEDMGMMGQFTVA